jgi:hypothetical protein
MKIVLSVILLAAFLCSYSHAEAEDLRSLPIIKLSRGGEGVSAQFYQKGGERFFIVEDGGARLKDEKSRRVSGDLPWEIYSVTCKEGDELILFCCFGWSGNGADDMRRISIPRATLAGNTIEIDVDYPSYRYSENILGTCDMYFVGYKIPLKNLKAGVYKIWIYGYRRTIAVDCSLRPPKETVTDTGERFLEKVIELKIEPT